MADPCARGCVRNGHHNPPCTCTPTCPNHQGHCFGCAPYEADTGRLCRACANRVRDALHTIPDLLQQLGQRGGRIDNHTHTIHLKPVFGYRTPSPAFDLADDTTRLILAWVDTTCDMTEQVGPRRYDLTGIPDPHTPIRDLCTWLAEHLEWAATEQPAYIHDELTQARRTLEHALSLDRYIERIPEPCPACGTGQLTRQDGTESIHCDNPTCNRVWRRAEWLARLQAQDVIA